LLQPQQQSTPTQQPQQHPQPQLQLEAANMEANIQAFKTIANLAARINREQFIIKFGSEGKYLWQGYKAGKYDIVSFLRGINEFQRVQFGLHKIEGAEQVLELLAAAGRVDLADIFRRAFGSTGEHLFDKFQAYDGNWASWYRSLSFPAFQLPPLLRILIAEAAAPAQYQAPAPAPACAPRPQT
jgi:hypothetical protein